MPNRIRLTVVGPLITVLLLGPGFAISGRPSAELDVLRALSAEGASEKAEDLRAAFRALLSSPSDDQSFNEGLSLVSGALYKGRIPVEVVEELSRECKEVRGGGCFDATLDVYDLNRMLRRDRVEILKRALESGGSILSRGSHVDCRMAVRWAAREGLDELVPVIRDRWQLCPVAGMSGISMDEVLIAIELRKGSDGVQDARRRAVDRIVNMDVVAYSDLLGSSPQYQRVVSTLILEVCSRDSADTDECLKLVRFVESVCRAESRAVLERGDRVWGEYKSPWSPDYWWLEQWLLLDAIGAPTSLERVTPE